MKILVARSAGFCFGVRRAVNMVYESIGRYASLSTLGPIIHNPQVVSELEQLGVKAAASPEEVNTEAVVIRSHGCAKQVRETLAGRGITVIDATCPYVAKIQRTVEAAYTQGKRIVIVGESEHPEVVGINGYCEGSAEVINSLEEAQKLEKDEKIICLVAQTTTNQKKWQIIVEFLSKSGYNVEVHNTICAATSARQQEAEELAGKCDCMIVIGGRNSSNTNKLYRLCKQEQNRTYAIESSEELGKINFNNINVIGISAGASTPDRVIKEVVTRMSEQDKLETQDSDFIEEMGKALVRIKPGQQIKGTVIYVDENEVGVNIGYKSDGFISKENLTINGDTDPREVVKPGDEIEVEIIKVNDGNGNVTLSKKAIEERLLKDKMLSQINSGEPFEVTVKEAVKGGLMAELDGIHVFIPASQIRVKGYVKDLTKFAGETFTVTALEVDTKKRRVVASRAAVLAKEQAEKAEKFWSNIHEGDVVKGIVRRITDFGAFVDIGGYDGLLHIGDIAWYRIGKVSDCLNIGDEVEVTVLSLNREKEQISLGRKQLLPKPWADAEERFAQGTVVHGTVVRIASFGAFVNIAPGIDGMVHISEIVNRYIKKVEEVLKVGDEVDAVVLNCDAANKRISLSIKALLPEEDGIEDEILDDVEPVEE